MFKALGRSRFPFKLCQCQIVPISYQTITKRQILPNIQIKNEIPFDRTFQLKGPNYTSSLNNSRRFCTSESIESDDEGNEEIIEFDELSDYIDGNVSQITDFLYGSLGSEELMVKIIKCSSETEVLGILKRDLQNFGKHHAVLSVVKLWDCKKIKLEVPATVIDDRDTFMNDENFCSLLDKIVKYSGHMTVEELSVCFSYLTKLTVNMQTDAMTTILELILKILKNDEPADIPLSALSRFIVAANKSPQLYTVFVCQDALVHIIYNMNKVTETIDLRLLAICLNNVHQLISSDLLELFAEKVNEILASGKLKNDCKTIIKVVQFLGFPHWSQDHLPLIRSLVTQLIDRVETFSISELETIGMVFRAQLEPASIVPKIAQYSNVLLKKNPTPQVLACTVMYTTADKRQKLVELADKLIFSCDKPDRATLTSLYKILRQLKVSNINTCNEYWSKVKTSIVSNISEQESYVLERYCHRYMHFNNNLNGTYRHIQFEKALVKLITNDFEHGITALLPSKFTKAASFLLSYGHTPKDKYVFPEFIVDKMESMQEQFTIFDCTQFAKGIRNALQLRFKPMIHRDLASQILRIENVLNACAERHLLLPNLSLSDLNKIVRSYNDRKSSKKASIYDKIMRKYETVPHHPLTSRTIRDITYNLNAAKYKLPSLCESLNEYIINNNEYVLGDTVQKVLFCFYNLNYYPKNEKIFKYASDIINRDLDYMSGLAIIQACLALALFKELPENLVERVFNINFIQRLEDEIEMCYSKEIYPKRVLNAVMQLNRAVCLDFPEYGVPWFQQNYIEARMTKVPSIKNKFFNDVKNILIDYVCDETFIKIDQVTPYGYKIDFILSFDSGNNKLLKPSNVQAIVHKINKVAIILLNSDSYCQNDYENMSGKSALKKRHLEMMGYKVVQINYRQWNSMYMNLPGAKVNYLKSVLLV